jgi:hypothetical protein
VRDFQYLKRFRAVVHLNDSGRQIITGMPEAQLTAESPEKQAYQYNESQKE